MCGIVGVITKRRVGMLRQDALAFKQLLFAGQIRGTDGTGIIYDIKEKTMFHKSPTDAYQFMGTNGFNGSIADSEKSGRYIIGHNRAATKGSRVWEDTHPFHEQNIVLVHNGTLYDHKELADVSVDSRAIAIHMSKEGVDKTIETLNGAFALVWVDTVKNSINLIRNDERPLAITETATCWIISSEASMGKWIAERNGYLEIKPAVHCKPGTLYTFDLNKQEMGKYETRKLKLRKPFVKWGNFEGYAQQTAVAPYVAPLPTMLPYEEKTCFFKDDTIHFVTDDEVRHSEHGYFYMTGEVVKDKVEHLTTFKQSVRIFGNKEKLDKLKFKGKLVGKVLKVNLDKGEETYYVTEVQVLNGLVIVPAPVKIVLENCIECGFDIHNLATATKGDFGYECGWCTGKRTSSRYNHC